MFSRNFLLLLGLGFALLHGFLFSNTAAKTVHYTFVLQRTPYTRLCSTKSILTINGEFPGPIIYAHKGDTVIVNFFNKADENITLHWHGIKQPRNPWYDGPEFITQCPVQPGTSFNYTVLLSSEEGTSWWHAHSDWSRATVHGAIIIYPNQNSSYPFEKPLKEIPIILGSWYKSEVSDVLDELIRSGGEPNISDAHTINGQPGDLLPCSKQDTFRVNVTRGKTYMLRIVNAGMNTETFFAIAQHNLTVVGRDGVYFKPVEAKVIMITPGQTMDALITANQPQGDYYMAARPYVTAVGVAFDNTTATAILHYSGEHNHTQSSPVLPQLPEYNDTTTAINFVIQFRSLNSAKYPVIVRKDIDVRMTIVVSVNTLPCHTTSCAGPNGTRLSTSMNNISFVLPTVSILDAYYEKLKGVYTKGFPNKPPYYYNFTADEFPPNVYTPKQGTKVKVLEYDSSVEIVLQGTNLLAGENHPIHLHGYSFFVVGLGNGNFDEKKDPLKYNLVDPPKLNTIGIPKNGWIAFRFVANNPGVWFMHCHLERHTTWGMMTAFIVKDGNTTESKMLRRPPYMPPC